MTKSRSGAGQALAAAALVLSWTLVGMDQRTASAEVSAVRGSAYGYFTNVGLFGGAPTTRGPAPTVTLPAAGSAAPVTSSAATGNASYGPGIFFTSGPISVSTQGTTGAAGSVTSTTTIQTVNTSGSEVFTATSAASTCTASETGVTGSATITGGTLQTSDGDPNVDGDETVVTIPNNPAPNTSYNGTLTGVGDTFRYVFNEQITNPDGSLTVNAAHQYALGPTAVGELIIGQVICGVTASGTPPTTAPPTTAPPTTAPPTTAPPTTAPPTTDPPTTDPPTTTSPTTTSPTTAPATTAPSAGGTVGGGAYGYFTDIGLFGGAPATRGPAPTVTLPAAGSTTPITGSAATGDARYGPGIFFTSGPITVSTQGTPGGTVASSSTIQTVNTSGVEVFTAANVASKCEASAAGATGSTTITGGRLQTSDGDPAVDGDEVFVNVPANPAPNTTFTGKLNAVEDEFRYVFNEQKIVEDGSIVVNAAHQYALGPTAKGELVIGQSRCATTATAFANTAPGGQTGGGAGGGTSAAGASGALASTGTTPTGRGAFGVALVIGGLLALQQGRRRRLTSADDR